jgi:DNA-binding NarL/FixJ family response regulator
MSNEFNPIRVVVAHEDPVICRELRRSLESEQDISILGEARDAHHAFQLTRQNRPDIFLVDFALAQRCGLKALNDSPPDVSPIRIVVIVAEIEKARLVEAFSLGAHGVVLKYSTPQVLRKSIRSVMAGQYWLERESVGVLVEALRESLAHGNGTKSPKDYGLTRREVDIITKIASGRSNKEVGEEFAISERTVKHHLTNIFGKVGVSSRLQLALFAFNQRIATTPAPTLALQPDDDI